MRHFYIFVMLFTISFATQAQELCSFKPSEAFIQRLKTNIATAKASQGIKTRATIYVPIKFHLVADTDGEGRIEEYKIYDELCNLNEAYAPLNMQFYIAESGFNYIDNGLIYSVPAGSTAPVLMVTQKNLKGQNALNIFITNKADTGNTSGTTLGYYTGFYDWVVIRKDQIGKFSGTVPHEIGHFFSLMHTFYGWESDPYDEDKHGNPVSNQYTSDGVLIELADKSNCEDAADHICDTNPDYNFGFGWNGCNEYTPEIKDYNGDIIDVVEENFMGYFIGCSDYFFTEGQQEAMLADYNSSARDYLKTDFVPTGSPIEVNDIEQISPENKENLLYFTDVKLDWTDVPNATKYYIKLLQGVNYVETFVTLDSELTLAELTPYKTYRWEVSAVNDFPGCSVKSNQQSFKTGGLVGNDDVSNLDISLYPTIISDRTMIIESGITAKAQISIINIQGQTSFKFEKHLNEGMNDMTIPTSIAKGLYIIHVETAQGMTQAKVVIQ